MRCPNCRQETTWEENEWRPFCSERCQLIDLGRWASEDYRIPVARMDGLEGIEETSLSARADAPEPEDA
ncbi:MAG: DNA gyrase inhibitor YacG [Blastocatellia bacterium]